MAATAAAILPSREDPRAALRIAQNNERIARQARTKATASFGALPTLNASFGEGLDEANPANNNAYFRAAQQRERLRRQVGSAVPLFPQPESETEQDPFESAGNYLQAAENTYANAMTGGDGRARSAIRGEINAYTDKAMEEAMKAVVQKTQEVGQKWMISLFKNGIAVTEIPPWAAWMIEILTYLYDCVRAVVTIFVPEPHFDISQGPSKLAVDATKKTIRSIFPPFSLSDPAGLLGFFTQTMVVLALITIAIFLFALVVYIIMGLYELASTASLVGG